MRKWLNWRLMLAGSVAVAVAGVVAAAPVAAAPNPVNGAAFTTTNPAVDNGADGDPVLCLNGNPGTSGPNYVPAINCNIYTSKSYVWLSGGPGPSHLSDGSYFFAVLIPGGQPDPNDGGTKNLSDTTCAPYTCPAANGDGSSIPSGDSFGNRTFSISDGTISYSGSHTFDAPASLIRLFPYDDTTNPGGVYIMAICSLAGGYPVNPSNCKYDAFKVQQANVPTPPAADLIITKDAAGFYTNTYAWTIQKDVDQTTINSSDGSATFNYTVTVTHDGGTISGVNVSGTIHVFNPNVDSDGNALPVAIDGVTDQLSDGTVCSVTGGGAQSLTDAETDFAYSCALSALPQGDLDNVATVTWADQILADDAPLAAGSADFTFTGISFTANLVDECAAVTDTFGGSLGTVCVGDPNPKAFTYSHTFTGDPAGTCTDHNNTATFTTTDTSTTGSDSEKVTVCVGADLTVSKTATPSYTRTYLWQITKGVSPTFLDAGGNANYTVVVSETGLNYSNFKVSGTITVHNPNDWEAIAANLSDSIDNSGVCSITGTTSFTLAAGATATRDYSCTFASNPGTGTNTATGTWDGAAAFTPHSSASGTASYTFGAPTTTVNKTVTVTDTIQGTTTTLGTVTATDSTPFASRTFTYTRHFNPPALGCVTIPNTATITETGQNASASVRVCNTGALTMGFWQNKNGQAIIAGANQAALGTWLRQFHAFADAPSTNVAAYANSIIKVAVCTSTTNTCNSMLRAQMLATALDVYFSDPALGGNRISAPAPIGGVTIDLTKIWGSENVSSAFGGATSMTVMNMLIYQNTSDPLADNGAAWYGQNKALQVLAKDAFDSINNQTAVSP